MIANYSKAKFHYLSAPAASVKDIREIIAAAKDRLAAKTVVAGKNNKILKKAVFKRTL